MRPGSMAGGAQQQIDGAGQGEIPGGGRGDAESERMDSEP